MRETRIILIVIIALVFIVGIYYGLSSNLTTPVNNTTNTTNNTTQNQTNSTQNQTNNTTYTSNGTTSNSNNNQQSSSVSKSNSKKSSSSSSSSDDGAVSEEWKENYQAGDGSYYREVDYKDGGMRQYDTNGKLIGSTYDSDQDQLPSME